MSSAYEEEKNQFRKFLAGNSGRSGREEEIRTTPLFSLTVKHAVDSTPAGPTTLVATDEGKTASSLPSERPGVTEEGSTGSLSIYSSSPPSSDKAISCDAPPISNLNTLPSVLPQYGLLGHHIGEDDTIGSEEPILLNVNAPNSAFICGSQGSGKSYTLSCMLENCLLTNTGASKVNKPVAGVVFHYDTNSTPTVAEAAYLCSRGVKVNVFISPCNLRMLGGAYEALGSQYGNVTVKPLLFRSSDLDTDRINKLMCVAEGDGRLPLYLGVIQKILRDMAKAGTFSYANFIAKVNALQLMKDQSGPLKQRLALLESFMNEHDILMANPMVQGGGVSTQSNNRLFSLDPGTLTIIDLTDTFVDASTACILFDITLGLIQEQRPPSGLIITLDEAHRFLTKTSSAAETFTEGLLTIIRTQRHTATRIIIATQEPTISEKLMDLCSMSIIHRFTSPAWFGAIKDHLCGASKMVQKSEGRDEMFERIVSLGVGESLVFSPAAFVGMGEGGEVRKLGAKPLRMKTRRREGVDGGMSLLAEGAEGVEGTSVE